ncbi:MAG: hypothetical protein ACLP62_04220 [Acidimicrobiales bacterium]
MTQHRVPNQSQDRIAPIRRDAALSRLSRTTRAVGVSVAVVAGLLAFYLGRALPGHHGTSANSSGASPAATTPAAGSGSTSSTSTTTPAAASGSTSSTSTTTPAAASGSTSSTTGSSSGTAAPVTQAPARATAPPVATSGAS